MDLFGLLAQSSGLLLFTLFGFFALLALVVIFYSDNGDRLSYRWPAGLLSGVIAILFLLMWWFAQTHAVIGVNRAAIVVDNTTGQVVYDQNGVGLHHAGLIEIPALNVNVFEYPSSLRTEWCDDSIKPAVQGGFEIQIKLCTYFDGSAVNWLELFLQSDQRSQEGVYNYLLRQIASTVYANASTISVSDLGNDYRNAQDTLTAGVASLLEEQGITTYQVTIPWWDFTNSEVAALFDLQAEAFTRRSEAQAELEAAGVEVEVLTTLAQGQSQALQVLGITDQEVVAWYLVQQKMIEAINSNPDRPIIFTMGDTPPITIQPDLMIPTPAE